MARNNGASVAQPADETEDRPATRVDRDVEHRIVQRPAKTSAAAAFALVFGVAALLSVLTVILSPVGLVLGIIGLVLGVLGIREPAPGPGRQAA